MKRGVGILMPVSALPCKYGIGSFGEGAYRFVDYLKKAGQKYWQILPLVQTGYGDSPYQSCSDNSGNPYFIDLEILFHEGLLKKRELPPHISKGDRIDYGELYRDRYPLLRKAFSRFDRSQPAFVRFCESGEYNDYALFMTAKQIFGVPVSEFPEEIRRREPSAMEKFARENKEETDFWLFVRYEFAVQWRALKKYANTKGIEIIGDLPLYVSEDSADVWANPELFKLRDDLTPEKVAGVPPDYFSADGQLWGNPVYDYERHKKDDFSWWKKRICRALDTYDYVRIDHFRGLDRYWEIDADAQSARFGEWVEGPGAELFDGLDRSRIIAEDLGVIDDGVRALLAEVGVPNMAVLSFAFDGDENNLYLPWKVGENSVYYTGTHDNDTVIGLYESLPSERRKFMTDEVNKCLEYFEIRKKAAGKYALCNAFTDIVYASRANVAIVPMADVLALDGHYRINEPGTVDNWRVRYDLRKLTETSAEMLARKVRRFER